MLKNVVIIFGVSLPIMEDGHLVYVDPGELLKKLSIDRELIPCNRRVGWWDGFCHISKATMTSEYLVYMLRTLRGSQEEIEKYNIYADEIERRV